MKHYLSKNIQTCY